MGKKLFILISVLLISYFVSPNSLFAQNIKISKKTSNGSYTLLELKNNFSKTETKKITTVGFKIEKTAMSKFPATLLGAGIGLVGGAIIGGAIGSIYGAHSSEPGLHVGVGAGIGGLSGLVIGGVVGYILGK